jgi:hypothetical protein
MKMIVISEKEFENAFQNIEYEYSLEFSFMKSNELPEDFVKTKRYEMLTNFKKSINELKNRLKTN